MNERQDRLLINNQRLRTKRLTRAEIKELNTLQRLIVTTEGAECLNAECMISKRVKLALLLPVGLPMLEHWSNQDIRLDIQGKADIEQRVIARNGITGFIILDNTRRLLDLGSQFLLCEVCVLSVFSYEIADGVCLHE